MTLNVTTDATRREVTPVMKFGLGGVDLNILEQRLSVSHQKTIVLIVEKVKFLVRQKGHSA